MALSFLFTFLHELKFSNLTKNRSSVLLEISVWGSLNSKCFLSVCMSRCLLPPVVSKPLNPILTKFAPNFYFGLNTCTRNVLKKSFKTNPYFGQTPLKSKAVLIIFKDVNIIEIEL